MEFPKELDAELTQILGMPNFVAAPFAHIMRKGGGVDIPRKSEIEQAHVIHWMVGLYLEHGADWRKKAQEQLKIWDEAIPSPNCDSEEAND